MPSPILQVCQNPGGFADLPRERMLKSDLINILVAKRGMTQKQAEATIETIFESMKDALCAARTSRSAGSAPFT